MASTRGNAIALQQGNIIATAFHPEITDDPRIGDMRGDRLEQAGGAQQFALRRAFAAGQDHTADRLIEIVLFEPIAAHIAAGKPVFGTCAGMILLARRLENDANVYFGALDATVRRNAYGRQREDAGD